MAAVLPENILDVPAPGVPEPDPGSVHTGITTLKAPAAVTLQIVAGIASAAIQPFSVPGSPPGTGSNPVQDQNPQSELGILSPTENESWLSYLNQLRLLADLPPLVEDESLSSDAGLHAVYMVKNFGHVANPHKEDELNIAFTSAGDLAAQNSNVATGFGPSEASFRQPIDGWMTNPFHAVGILDPHLTRTGFSLYSEQLGGLYLWTAVLDVLRGRDLTHQPGYPVIFPADGKTLPFFSYAGFEYPDPLTGCPGFSPPTGAPLYLLLGQGQPYSGSTGSLIHDGTVLEICLIDKTNYFNSDPNLQRLGRDVMSARGAVVILPKYPLQPDTQYSASITADGRVYSWSFSTSSK